MFWEHGAHEGCIASCIQSQPQPLMPVALSLANQICFPALLRTHSGAFPSQSPLITPLISVAHDFLKLVGPMMMKKMANLDHWF